MRLAAITYSSPWGRGELFVTREIAAIKEECPHLIVVPLTPQQQLFHNIGKQLALNSIRLPLVNVRMVLALLEYGVSHPLPMALLLRNLVGGSRSLAILLRNLAVLPKSVYVAKLMQKSGVNHIHANWATTPATMAYIISSLTGIRWSLRTHRWDIYQNNMLTEKVRSAQFVLCVSEVTRRAILDITGEEVSLKVFNRPVGMCIELLDERLVRERIMLRQATEHFELVTPANLIPVKGHRYLLGACVELVSRGLTRFHCTLFGDGPLQEEIQSAIMHLGLQGFVELRAAIPNDELLGLYRDNRVDLLVLPSITTSEGEHEGLPTVLVEAMSFGIPVISTDTGGIPELLSDGAGLLVREKSRVALADAIEHVMNDQVFATDLAVAGWCRAVSKHDVTQNAKWILARAGAEQGSTLLNQQEGCLS